MRVNIKGHDIELHYGLRTFIIYENLMDKGIDEGTFNTLTGMIVLIYCSLMASIQYHKLDLVITYDEYIDWLDSQDTSKLFTEYSLWFADNVSANKFLQNDRPEKEEQVVQMDEESKKK